MEEAVAAWQPTRLLARLERAEGHPALRGLLVVLGLADHHQGEAFDLGRRAELGGRLLHLLIETPEKLVVLRANLAKLELAEQPGRRRVDAERLGIDDLFLLLLVAELLLLALAHGVRG